MKKIYISIVSKIFTTPRNLSFVSSDRYIVNYLVDISNIRKIWQKIKDFGYGTNWWNGIETRIFESLKPDSHLSKKLCYLLRWKSFKNDEKYFLFHLKSSCLVSFCHELLVMYKYQDDLKIWCNYSLVLSLAPTIKILLILAKNSWKTDIEHFP